MTSQILQYTPLIAETVAKTARRSTGSNEEFPETGDRFTGTCTVKSVIGGNGHTVHGVTLTDFTGILSGEGDAETDCAQHSAAAPVAGVVPNAPPLLLAAPKAPNGELEAAAAGAPKGEDEAVGAAEAWPKDPNGFAAGLGTA